MIVSGTVEVSLASCIKEELYFNDFIMNNGKLMSKVGLAYKKMVDECDARMKIDDRDDHLDDDLYNEYCKLTTLLEEKLVAYAEIIDKDVGRSPRFFSGQTK